MTSRFLSNLQERCGIRSLFPPMSYAGIAFDADQFYVASITQHNKTVSILSLQSQMKDAVHQGEDQKDEIQKSKDQENNDHVKPLYIRKPQNSRAPLGGHSTAFTKNTTIACAIPGLKTLSKHIHIDLTKPHEIDSALPFQLEQSLPYPLESCIIDKVILGHEDASTRLIAFSVLKDDIKEQTDLAKQYLNEAEYAIPKAVALARFSNLFLGNATRIIIDLAYDETTLVLLHEGMPQGVRTLPNSLVSREIQADNEHLKQFSNELMHAIYSFQSIYPMPQTLPVTFTGPVESDPYLLSILGKLLGVQVETMKMAPKNVVIRDGITREGIFSHAVPIGLALAAAVRKKDGLTVNFRQGELAFPNRWSSWRNELCLYFFLMASLSALLYCYLDQDVEQRLAHLQNTVHHIEEILEMPVETAAYSISDIQRELSAIHSELQKPGDEFPLYPQVPKVSDVLAFLSTHPKVILDKDGDAKNNIRLESFTYTLVKRPEKGRIKEHYQVRVDLDFTAPNPTIAREFHEALLAPNAFVDPKGEVKWNMQKGLYKTSFFLNDKTIYPIGGNS